MNNWPLSTPIPNRIFVTGVFASGKTHFCTKLYKKFGGTSHEYIDFDKYYDYGARSKKSLDIVYREMDKCKRSIMDAVPAWKNGPDPDKFYEYYKENDCSIILIKCAFEVWEKRLKSKAWYSAKNMDRYIKGYNKFYDVWVKRYLLDKNIDLLLFDSVSEKYIIK